MENLTEIERGLLVLALQGLAIRQPQTSAEVLVIVKKLGLMDQLTRNLQSWIAWSIEQPPMLAHDSGDKANAPRIDWAKMLAGLPVAALPIDPTPRRPHSSALCPDEQPGDDGRVTSWGHPLDEPRYLKPDGTIDWEKLMGDNG